MTKVKQTDEQWEKMGDSRCSAHSHNTVSYVGHYCVVHSVVEFKTGLKITFEMTCSCFRLKPSWRLRFKDLWIFKSKSLLSLIVHIASGVHISSFGSHFRCNMFQTLNTMETHLPLKHTLKRFSTSLVA